MMRQLPLSALSSPSMLAAELSRQHVETLQVVNQRFQLVTLAIVGTITILGWFASRIAEVQGTQSRVIVDVAAYVTFAGLCFLTLLYVLSHMLYRTIRIFDTLIYVRYEEPPGSVLTHEHLWARFRHRRYRAYSTPFAWIYGSLGISIWGLPWLLRIRVGSPAATWMTLDWATLVLLCVFVGFVGISTWGRALLVSEEELRRTWREVIAEIED